MRLHTFVERLRAEGLAMHNTPSVFAQTMGGLFATACHGSGIGSPGMSSSVEAVGIVPGNVSRGDVGVMELRKGDLEAWKELVPQQDGWRSLWSKEALAAAEEAAGPSAGGIRERALLFDAARANLGALGIVVWLELRVVSAFDLVAEESLVLTDEVFAPALPGQASPSLGTARWPTLQALHEECATTDDGLRVDTACLARSVDQGRTASPEKNKEDEAKEDSTGPATSLPALAARCEFFKLWVIPHTPHSVVHCIRRRTERDPPVAASFLTRIHDEITADLFDLSMWLGARFPSLQPLLNSLSASTFATPRVRIAPADRLTIIAYRVPWHTEIEWSVPARHASALHHAFEAAVRDSGTATGFVQEWRFAAPDDTLASPDQAGPDGAEPRVHITLGLRDPELSGFSDGFFGAMERSAAPLGGRFHWAKRSGITEVSASPKAVRALYPRGQLEAMAEAARILDPKGTFRNSWLNRVIGE